MQSQVQQGMHGRGETGQGEEIAQEEVQILVRKGDILTTQLRGHQRIIRVDATHYLLPSPAREYKLVPILNLPGSSQIHFLGESMLNQINGHFIFQSQWV